MHNVQDKVTKLRKGKRSNVNLNYLHLFAFHFDPLETSSYNK